MHHVQHVHTPESTTLTKNNSFDSNPECQPDPNPTVTLTDAQLAHAESVLLLALMKLLLEHRANVTLPIRAPPEEGGNAAAAEEAAEATYLPSGSHAKRNVATWGPSTCRGQRTLLSIWKWNLKARG